MQCVMQSEDKRINKLGTIWNQKGIYLQQPKRQGIKPSYLYKLMMRRAIPYYKPNGKLCFFSKENLDAWLRNIRVKSQAEIDSDAAGYR